MSRNTKKQAGASIAKLKPSQLVEALDIVFNGLERITTFIWGEPGIGKSSVIKEWALSKGYEFVDIRLSSYDNTDISGFPYMSNKEDLAATQLLIDEATAIAKNEFAKLDAAQIEARFMQQAEKGMVSNASTMSDAAKAELVEQQMISDAMISVKPVITREMHFTTPHRFPTDPDAKVVILLDELNGAQPQVLLAAYQLILDRQIGAYKLPENVILIAAGNNESDRGVTYRMPTPIANRMIHLEMRHDFEDWFNYAINNQYSPMLVGFLKNAPAMLHSFDASSASKGFATPRSWGFVNTNIRPFEIKEQPLPTNSAAFNAIISGAVGDAAATMFKAHTELVSELPPLDQIFTGKAKARSMKDDPALSYSLSTSGMYYLRDMYAKVKEASELAKSTKDAKDIQTHKELDEAYNMFIDNFMQYMEDNTTMEAVLMAFRLAVRTYAIRINPTVQPKAGKLLLKYQPMIVKANN